MKDFIRVDDFLIRKSEIVCAYKTKKYVDEDDDGKLICGCFICIEYQKDKKVEIELKNGDEEFEKILKEIAGE